MDWVRGLQNAIDYMEDHLSEELSVSKAAEKAYSSSFHFQRTFHLLTGITVGEYIRNRRLSLAGDELSVSEAKVIDVALKYGYDTPESFTKAFMRFHGITPSQARRSGAKLKFYNRLSIKIILEGGNVMEYRIEKRDSFKVLAKVKGFNIGIIGEGDNQEIPGFWSECWKDGTVQRLHGYGRTKDLLGICEPEKPGEDTFRYGIGVVYTDTGIIPEDLELWSIPEQLWAVFKCKGALPEAIRNMWKRVYSEFFPQSEYEHTGGIDFEVDPAGDSSKDNYESEIWIPVRKKA